MNIILNCFAPAGNSVGTALTYPLCGLLISSLGSWVWAFYVPGLLALLWSAAWALLAFDTPALHPRISLRERAYLEKNVAPFLAKSKVRSTISNISGPSFDVILC